MSTGRLVAALVVAAPAAAVAVVLLYLPLWAGPLRVARAAASSEALFAVKLSLVTATASSFLAVAAAVPAAYALSRGLVPWGRLLETLLLVPFGMPPVAVGASLLVFLTGPGRWLDETILHAVFTPRGLVVAQFAVVYPIAVRVLKTGFDAVSPEYEAVARTLGYSWLGAFTRVTLPMARRGLLTALLLCFTRSLGEFGASVMLAGAYPFRTETLPIAIYLAIGGGSIALAVSLIAVSGLVAAAGVAGLLYLEEAREERG